MYSGSPLLLPIILFPQPFYRFSVFSQVGQERKHPWPCSGNIEFLYELYQVSPKVVTYRVLDYMPNAKTMRHS